MLNEIPPEEQQSFEPMFPISPYYDVPPSLNEKQIPSEKPPSYPLKQQAPAEILLKFHDRISPPQEQKLGENNSELMSPTSPHSNVPPLSIGELKPWKPFPILQLTNIIKFPFHKNTNLVKKNHHMPCNQEKTAVLDLYAKKLNKMFF